jgi:hypothetical protein
MRLDACEFDFDRRYHFDAQAPTEFPPVITVLAHEVGGNLRHGGFPPIADIASAWKSERMHRPLVIAALTFVGSCSSPGQRRQQALMNEIEASIDLPKGARSLSSYARYYAYVTPDEIIGAYMVPHMDDPMGRQCEEIDANFTTRTVPCSLPAAEGKEVGSDERVWLNDWHNLPMADDGKCGELTFAFHAAAHRFEAISCVGISSDLRPHPDDVGFYERPRAFAAALNSRTPIPIVVLLGDQRDLASPSFALYDDGTVIKASKDGYITDKLTPDARDQFLGRLNVEALRGLYGGFRVATSSDQPSEDLLFYVGTKPVFISIYGSLANPLVRVNVPAAIMAAYTKIKSLELPHARKWSGTKFPHDELWSSPNNEAK